VDDIFGNNCFEKETSVITASLLKLASDASVRAELSDIDHYAGNLRSVLKEGELPSIENALLGLYVRLHGAGSGYSAYERKILVKRKGYSCHPGGLSALVRAVQFIRPDSIVADLGAGNGLQGLLLQCICPHRKTIQIEISSEMIRVGRIFQQALGISADRVEWVHDDIVNASIEEADFIYLYLPAKPLDGGKKVYEAVARKINAIKRPVVIFSIADCLAGFLAGHLDICYTDGHLTCFVNK